MDIDMGIGIDTDIDIAIDMGIEIDIDISCSLHLLLCLTFYSFFPNSPVSDPLLSRQLRGTARADSVLLRGKRSCQLHLVFRRCDSQWEDRP